MSNIVLYDHGGSGNHGCEAIVRSTIKLLDSLPGERYLISASPEEDKKYGINNICHVLKDIQPWPRRSKEFISAYLQLKIRKDYKPLDKLNYLKTFECVNKNDIALSIGGDNYCYADVENHILQHQIMIQRRAKTVLWGCSIEPNLLNNNNIVKDLAQYDLITARESITYREVKKVNPNTILVPDTAFTLQPVFNTLPNGFEEKKYVGINISPMIIDRGKISGIIFENYRNLIDYILDKTDLKIMLIPHVVWKDGDDRIPLKKLFQEYRSSDRIFNLEDCNCMELKGYIARSRFFIGARTHSTIAAYSSCVPTLTIGYSVKARGIAHDILGDEDSCISVSEINATDSLRNAYVKLSTRENLLVEKLQKANAEMEWTRAINKVKSLTVI